MSYNQFVYDTLFKNAPPPELPAGCVVHFRPPKNWDGDYGFDWIRIGKNDFFGIDKRTGDTDMFGDSHYASIMGKYMTADGDICNDVNGWEKYRYRETDAKGKTSIKEKACSFKHDPNNYNGLINQLFPYQLIIPWKKPDEKKTPKTGWKGEVEKTNYTYHIPVMTIRNGHTNQLELHVELEKNKVPPKEIVLREISDSIVPTNFFTFSPGNIPPQKGKYRVEVTCNSTFSFMSIILAVAVYADPAGGDDIEHICGLLRVIPNSIIPRKSAVIINVTLDIGNGVKTGVTNNTEIPIIRKILRQSYTEIDFEPNNIRLTVANPGIFRLTEIDGRKIFSDSYKIRETLEKEFNSSVPNAENYSNHIKIYVVDERYSRLEGSKINGFNQGDFVVLFSGRPDVTLAHEFLHGLDLHHSYVSKDGVQGAEEALYVFKAQSTENIMDYDYNDLGTHRISTWFWQWRVIWEKCNTFVLDVPVKTIDYYEINSKNYA